MGSCSAVSQVSKKKKSGSRHRQGHRAKKCLELLLNLGNLAPEHLDQLESALEEPCVVRRKPSLERHLTLRDLTTQRPQRLGTPCPGEIASGTDGRPVA